MVHPIGPQAEWAVRPTPTPTAGATLVLPLSF